MAAAVSGALRRDGGQSLLPPLRHPVTRLLLVAFAALHVVLALGATGPAPRTLIALVLVLGAAAAVVLPNRAAPALLVAAAAATLTATGVVLAALPLAGWPGYAAWPLGATTFIALALALRGRIGLAWALLGVLAAESVVWSLAHGAGPLPGVDLVIRHAGTLLLGTLFAVGLRRAAAAFAALRDAERVQRADRAATEAAGAEQRRSAERFLALAAGELRRLARADDGDPGALLALEGRLRDEITAAPLLTERLIAAAAAVRARGVDLVLLEDGALALLPPGRRAEVADWLAERLQQAPDGRFVFRAVRVGRVLRASAHGSGSIAVLELPLDDDAAG